MFGIDSFNSTPILPTLNMPSHSFTLHTENAKTFLAQSTEAELLEGYVPATDEDGYAYNLMAIQQNYCPDVGTDETCSGASPFSQFTIRGNEGLGDPFTDGQGTQPCKDKQQTDDHIGNPCPEH